VISIDPLCGALNLEETFATEEEAENSLLAKGVKIKNRT
jgi:hypothetical protein